MLDDYLLDQPIAVKILKNSIKKNKLVHAYLFETNGYDKIESFILAFIKSLLCPSNFFEFSDCSNCSICQMITDKCYPEIKFINPEGMWIKKEQLDNLQQEFSKKAIIGNKKIYIINEAEKMNISAANSILKFLEEPSPDIIAILVTNNIYQLLDTIISRCQIISFRKKSNNCNSELEFISNYSFYDSLKKEAFLSDSNNIDLINNVKKFVDYYENNHFDTLLYTQKLWFNYFPDKEKNILAYDIMILYYRDVLNIKLGHDVLVFKNNAQELLKIANKNTNYDIVRKISKILNCKQKMKNNINLNLLMDNLILDLEGR